MKADNKFRVHCLPWDEAWRLFKENVGEETLNYFPGAHGLAELVAKECDGLPLALIAIGRAMSTTKSVEEWKDATTTLKNSASEFPGMGDDILPRLKLSYDNLRTDTIKSCFRYCALFPEDYSIEIAKLVEYWIAEGILDGFDNNLDEARNRGNTIIRSLKSACLLESSSGQYNRKKTHVKMHDVIRDLALWIVNDCRSSDESGSTPNNKYLVAVNDPCEKWENAKRIFFWDVASADSSHSTTTRSNKLLTLIMVGKMEPRYSLRLSPSFFKHMPLLKVLDLSNTRLKNPIPNSICELHELQYLNLSDTYISELPVELRKLVKLKFLVLHDTSALKRRIPAGVIANLSELQVLDLSCFGFEDWELEDGPSFSELDGLKQLQQVRITIKTFVAFDKFLCNQKLQRVCAGLNFICKDKSSSSSRRELDLSNFKSLKDLKIRGFLELEKLVLYGSTTDAGLLSNLETLTLASFPKLNSIQWMAAQPNLLRSYFQNLHYISIAGCDALKDLTWLVYVQNLEKLYVNSCEGLEAILELGDDGLEGGTEGGDQMLNTGGVFRRLKTLFMNRLPKLKSICRHALSFPSIETISIFGCPELKRLPLGSGSNVENNLKHIRCEPEWWNELQWEDETIKSKFLPYSNKRN